MCSDKLGYYGIYGGQFVPETLIPCLEATENAYREAMADPKFKRELAEILTRYVGRPSPLTEASRLSRYIGGATIYLKREDLNHTGSHKINNTIGQALLAKRMGKHRLVAETGAGQHGVATATAAAMLGLKCRVFMGARDVERQRLNVFRMKMLGAEICPVTKGSQTLKDATNEAFRDFITNFEDSHLVAGSVVGPHPYPMIVRDLQSVIGRELRAQCLQYLGQLPDAIIACVGGGSNAMGVFYPFINDADVKLVGVEAGGLGIESGHHCSTINFGSDGVIHGAFTKLLQDHNGQVLNTHSVAAGLDYPGVGPEHAYFHSIGRVQYIHVSDQQALEAFGLLSQLEGIVPALESAHAVAGAIQLAPQMTTAQALVINISGRGDKDVETVSTLLGGNNYD